VYTAHKTKEGEIHWRSNVGDIEVERVIDCQNRYSTLRANTHSGSTAQMKKTTKVYGHTDEKPGATHKKSTVHVPPQSSSKCRTMGGIGKNEGREEGRNEIK